MPRKVPTRLPYVVDGGGVAVAGWRGSPGESPGLVIPAHHIRSYLPVMNQAEKYEIRVEVALDPDLVLLGLVHDRKVGTDVVSRDHHTW